MELYQQTWVQRLLVPIRVSGAGRKGTRPKSLPCTSKSPIYVGTSEPLNKAVNDIGWMSSTMHCINQLHCCQSAQRNWIYYDSKDINDFNRSSKTVFPLVLWHCWFGDRKGIRPVKSCMLVCRWWRFDWSFARLIAPVVTTTTSNNLRPHYDFLLTFYSNYSSISCRLWDIHCRKMSWPWNRG